MENINLSLWIKIAAAAQLLMAMGSLGLPHWLRWKESLRDMPVLLRQMFWVYSDYIWMTNISLGLVSLFYAADLQKSNVLAAGILVYAAAYWLIRVFLQFFYFDKKDAPKGIWFKLGEIALDANFIFLALVYSCALATKWF